MGASKQSYTYTSFKLDSYIELKRESLFDGESYLYYVDPYL
jgi:hypothetical protein